MEKMDILKAQFAAFVEITDIIIKNVMMTHK